MSGKNGGKTGSLSYRTGAEIYTPAVGGREGNLLTWRYRDILVDDTDDRPVGKPTEGCLEEFVGLAGAEDGPAAVLDFARRRGVLGLNPLVRVSWPGPDGGELPVGGAGPSLADWYGPLFEYQEHVSDYLCLSRRFEHILRIMQALKDGTPLSADGLARSLWPEDWRHFLASEAIHAPHRIYESALFLVRSVWEAATLRMGMQSLSVGAGGLKLGEAPVFDLSFGEWREGTAWDYRRARRYRAGGKIVLSEHEECSDSLPGDEVIAGERVGAFGDWAVPRSHHLPMVDWAFQQTGDPLNTAVRPSPLFNLLAFQLLRAATLPEGSYFCGHCRRLYTHNPELGNKPRRGGEAGAFCKPECRAAHKRAYDRERYAARKRRAAE